MEYTGVFRIMTKDPKDLLPTFGGTNFADLTLRFSASVIFRKSEGLTVFFLDGIRSMNRFMVNLL
jgi:hypothetical protein